VDGTGFEEYSNLKYPIGMCWSPDDSKLVVSAGHLDILDVATGSSKEIDGMNAYASDQCWSPDGNHVVYFENQDKGIRVVRIYDFAENKSRDIAFGGFPSWSPDGNRIAFVSCPPPDMNCAYQTIHPDDSGQTLLFRIEPGESPLWWSPDSQYVAYRSWRKFWEHSLFGKLEQLVPIEHLDTDDRLRIRRLDDNSEDWLLNIGDSEALSSFQWVSWIPNKN
jgi:dipeptidyl aminopeptidase/acylaminoacyl peptidase